MSQIVLYVCLVVLFYVDPSGWRANQGISYFGVQPHTLIPYVALFSLSSFCLLGAALALPKRVKSNYRMAYIMLSMILWMLGIMFTPYDRGLLYARAHETFGSILFVTQLALILWFVNQFRTLRILRWLFLFQLVGGIISFLSLPDILLWEIQGQILFQAAFGLALLCGLRQMHQRMNGANP